jgi:hypothetical protein
MSTTLDRLLRNVTPEDINAYINGLPTPNTFALTQSVIPERKIYGPKFRIESNKRRINSAKFRAFDTRTSLNPAPRPKWPSSSRSSRKCRSRNRR